MDYLEMSHTAPLRTHSIPEPSAGSIPQPPQGPPTSPSLTKESGDLFHGWKTIGEQQGFYDEEGFLYPSCGLENGKPEDRKEDDVVIFNCLLSRSDGDPPVEGRGPSSRSFGEDRDLFFQMPKDRLIETEQFSEVISPGEDPGRIQSQARLGVM